MKKLIGILIGFVFILSACGMIDEDRDNNDHNDDNGSNLPSSQVEAFAPLAFQALIEHVNQPIHINSVTYICYLYDAPYERYEACAFYTVYRFASGSISRYAEVWVEEMPTELYAYVYDLEDQSALMTEYEFLFNQVRFDSDYTYRVGPLTRSQIDQALANFSQ